MSADSPLSSSISRSPNRSWDHSFTVSMAPSGMSLNWRASVRYSSSSQWRSEISSPRKAACFSSRPPNSLSAWPCPSAGSSSGSSSWKISFSRALTRAVLVITAATLSASRLNGLSGSGRGGRQSRVGLPREELQSPDHRPRSGCGAQSKFRPSPGLMRCRVVQERLPPVH